MEVAYTIDAP